MAEVHLYGIRSCDTVKKACGWLKSHGVDYIFHDLRKEGVDAVQLRNWISQLGWQALLNRRSRTWRSLPESDRAGMDAEKALAMMVSYPTLIRRPVLLCGDKILAGFSPETYTGALCR